MADGPVRWLTRGDDAGSCQSANLATYEAFERGVMRNASVMVPGPAFEAAAALLSQCPGLCVGLHATLNAEWDAVKWPPILPAERVPHLVDAAGHLHAHPRLTHAAGATAEEILAELGAQLALARAHHLDVRYLDTHMGFGWIDGVDAGLADLARREGLVYRPAIDGHLRPYPPDEWTGDPVDWLVEQLRQTAGGTWLSVIHPGIDAPDMQRLGHEGLAPGEVARRRDAERRAWCDPRLLEYCRQAPVELVRYDEV